MRRLLVGLTCLLLAACSSDAKPTSKIPAYLATDSCSAHTDGASCTADTTNGCKWYAFGRPCVEGEPCPAGVCQAADPCAALTDATSCNADTADGCGWVSLGGSLCPPGAACPTTTTGDDGVCRKLPTDGCVCACPMYCPAGEDCPPCTCDCTPPSTPPGGGGGACTCTGGTCDPGQVCPPVSCDCSGGGSCTGGSTCTCACPACPPGATCPPCSCDCGGTTAPPPGTCTCDCPVCPAGQTCPPCTCGCTATGSTGSGTVSPGTTGSTGGSTVPVADPCSIYHDAASCTADTAQSCTWVDNTTACPAGSTCTTGTCFQKGTDVPPGGCTCVCPSCPAGTDCPPCDCTCGTTCP